MLDLELNFIYCMRCALKFSFEGMCVNIQLFQLHLLKIFFLCWIAFCTLSKIQLSLYVWIYLWVLSFVLLTYFCISIPIPHYFDSYNFIKDPHSSCGNSLALFFLRCCFEYWNHFVSFYKIACLGFWLNWLWISLDIFIILNLTIHGHSISFHF